MGNPLYKEQGKGKLTGRDFCIPPIAVRLNSETPMDGAPDCLWLGKGKATAEADFCGMTTKKETTTKKIRTKEETTTKEETMAKKQTTTKEETTTKAKCGGSSLRSE